MALEAIFQFIGYGLEGLAGWRYLLSPTYRNSVQQRWAKQPKTETVGEILSFVLSFIIVNSLLGCILWWFVSSSSK